MSSGGGQSGETRYEWNPTIGMHWGGQDGGEGGLLMRAVNNVLNSPYQRYGGQRVASPTGDQTQSGNLIRHVAAGNLGDVNAARNENMLTAQGNYLGRNPYAESPAAISRNQYQGENPYFQSIVDKGTKDITDAYNRGTSADTRRAFNMAGAFGGSAHQQAIADNEKNLGDTLSNYSNQMRNQQYERSTQLEEADINRRLQESQFYRGLGSGAWEGERGRMLQGSQLGMQGQGLSLDAARALMGYGDFERGYQQQLLDEAFREWSQGQDWERNNIGWMANLLGQAQGSTGVTQQLGGYSGVNPAAGILGAAALGSGMGWF